MKDEHDIAHKLKCLGTMITPCTNL